LTENRSMAWVGNGRLSYRLFSGRKSNGLPLKR